MSIKIRIEIRDDEGIFATRRMETKEMTALLLKALRGDDVQDIDGPYLDGVVQAFTIRLLDPREQWGPCRPPQSPSTAVHD